MATKSGRVVRLTNVARKGGWIEDSDDEMDFGAGANRVGEEDR